MLIAIVPTMISAPSVISQNLTTITSLQTVTTETDTTQLSTITTQTTSFATFTTTFFATSSLAQSKKIVSKAFTLSAPGQEYGCTYSGNQLISFSAQAGQVVTGTLVSDSEVHFYLMTSHDYDIWVSKTGCGVDNALVEAEAVKTYSLEFVIPSNDKYRFLLVNFSHEKDAKVNLTAQVIGTASSSSAVVTRTDVRQEYSTQTAMVPATVTQTATSLRTEQIGFSLEGSSLLLMVVGIVVGVAVVVGVFVLRGRQGKTKEETKLYEPEVEETPSPEPVAPPSPPRSPPPGMKFCVHCGEAIPRNARFCTKIGCGKPQG